ncbi:hypothetical protein GobsT_09680 [Gemmata obscuriglobus]|uniref:TIGR04255 family protein n=1 Tax=Gemmata obscuriglobus TaxID=114 RepID=A0A2Z3H3D1_9BACT|nr:TIGR04255 family protein [Gemmata obscuriglobus]AWM40523.1 TIGR04255 family protein [Gemmata obscuriglobus]QEG26229.1 hypothetical protein GobsT_09680 [Gemmata obscuriglobus]VTS00976.1 Uncharacterized protein OS=Oscillatoria nigro-viridis PCC 7112 GN=Osc7112_3964 PE=4 SV=1 [Gemmata obscuriglobus UQM 2246]
MNASGQYSRAPLIEAVLDIQVSLAPDFPLDKLQNCQKRVKAEYPGRKETRLHHGHFEFANQKSLTSTSTHPLGYQFVSADKKQVFQAKLDGFAFNRLRPYNGWDEFFAEARRLWEEYRRVTKPSRYNRVSLRYINRFDFPHANVKLETYFKTLPTIAPELPQDLGAYFFQAIIPLEENGTTVAITQTAVEPPAQGQVSVIFDLDLFCTEGIVGENDIWPIFGKLQKWKNKVFEACITEETRKLIS